VLERETALHVSEPQCGREPAAPAPTEAFAMDLNYILGREQHALHMAATSKSASARVAHRAFAKAYGLIVAASGFPHRDSDQTDPASQRSRADDDHETKNEGSIKKHKIGS
jgi:hypothetical protein